MRSLPISDRDVRQLIRECKHRNVFPIFLDSYIDGPSSDRISRLLNVLVEEATDYLSILDEDEVAGVVGHLDEFYQHRVSYRSSALPRQEILKRVALYIVISRVQQDYFSLQEVLELSRDDSLVLREYPELRAALDDDDLLIVDNRFTLHDGGIAYREHVLHYHQFLRRGYLSNPNFDFLGRFASLSRKTRGENVFRVAIDFSRLMRKEYYAHIVERDRWYGPTFDRASLDDPNAVGLTVIKRNKNSLFELTNHLERTEFFWSARDGIKSLEIEEIAAPEYVFDGFHINRYVHSERDIGISRFCHLDGAVKVYPQLEYPARFDSRLPHEPRSQRKIKLFRVDGDIQLEHWLELISYFYKSNEMILEYFDPETFINAFDERIRDFAAWKAKQ